MLKTVKRPCKQSEKSLIKGHAVLMDWKSQHSKDVLKLIFSSAAVPMKILAGCIYTYRQVDCKFYMEFAYLIFSVEER